MIHAIRPFTALAARPATNSEAASATKAPLRPQDEVTLDAAGARLASPTARKPEYMPDEVLVKFHRQASLASVAAFAQMFDLQTIRRFVVPPNMVQKFGGELYQFRLRPGDTVEKAVARFSEQPGVAFAEPNYRIRLDDSKADGGATAESRLVANAPERQGDEGTDVPRTPLPNDLDERLWGLRNTGQSSGKAGVDVGAAQAWVATTGKPNGQGPLICVIDSGIDYTHPDLAANMWTNPGEIAGDGVDNDHNGYVDDVHGANVKKHDGDPMDDNHHGTHCAGTIGAVGDNGIGIVGVGWNATVAAAKFLDAGGGGTYADAIAAVMYASAIGARVTSSSWGGGGFSQALHDAFNASPALHICAAGNAGADCDTDPDYPGSFDLDNIVNVAAIDRRGHLPIFSNYGATTVDVAAPGVDIYSTQPGNRYQSLSGTSMAAPHVTGVAGLVLSRFPDLTNEQLKARLVHSATPEDELTGKVVSGGYINAATALQTDEVAPAPITDLTVVERGTTSLTLGFTATGDDGASGRASDYHLRVSSQPIVDDASWNAATVVSRVPPPALAGTTERIRVQIPSDTSSKTWYFALRAGDKVGNSTPLATTSGQSVPVVAAFKDDFESDSGHWTSVGGWGRVDDPQRGGFVYQDSPGTNYPDNADTSLTSDAISLAGVKNPRLLFSEKHDLEENADEVAVEISADGKEWESIATFSGTADWSDQSLSLRQWEGGPVYVRFALTSDFANNQDGFSLDDLRIIGDPA